MENNGKHNFIEMVPFSLYLILYYEFYFAMRQSVFIASKFSHWLDSISGELLVTSSETQLL